LSEADQVALPILHEEATHMDLPPTYQRALAQNCFIPHQQNEQALLARLHKEMRTRIEQARKMEDIDYNNSRKLMKTLIRTLYTRRVHFLSEKLLLVHYGLVCAHLFAQNNSSEVHRDVNDRFRLTASVPFNAPRATVQADSRIPLRMEGIETYVEDCYNFFLAE
jgi:hypothetical protein